MISLDELEAKIEDLRAQLHSVAKGDGLKTKAAGFRLGSMRVYEDVAGILRSSGKITCHYGTAAERAASGAYQESVFWWESDNDDLYMGTGAAWQMIGGASGAAPGTHHATHENTAADEISVTALSGLLADDQHVLDAEAIAAVEGEATLDLTGDVTIAATKSLAVDTISEKTGAAGVTVDGTLLKDGDVYPDTNDLNLWFGKIGSNFFLQADTGDFIHYNVGLNKWYFYIGAAQRFTVDASVISAKSKPIQDVTDPTNAQDAATKNYVDLHAIASHNDTTATGTELETLTDGSDADALHDHATLATAAEAVAAVEAANPLDMTNTIQVDTINEHTGAAGVTIDGTLLKDGGITAGSNIVSDTDSTDDLGSAAKYWANVYADKLYLNATATLGGGTAGQVTLTGNLDVSANIAAGSDAAVNGGRILNIDGELTPHPCMAGYLRAIGTAAAGAQVTIGLGGGGIQRGTPAAGFAYGLNYTAIQGSASAMSVLCSIYLNLQSEAGGTGAIDSAYGLHLASPVWGGANPVTTRGIAIEDQGDAATTNIYGIHLKDQTATTITRLLEIGPVTPYLRLVGGANPAANQTNLYLKEEATLRQVQWKDFDDLESGDKVMILV